MSTSESLFSKVLIRCNTTSHRLAKHHRLFSMFSSKNPRDSLDSSYYFPLVSGSTTNLVFKENTHPHGKSVSIRVQKNIEIR